MSRNTRARPFLFALSLLCATAVHAAVEIAVVATPDPAMPGEQILIRITVSNSGAAVQTGLTVDMDYPSGMAAVFESVFTEPFTDNCTSTSCSPGEMMIWDVGTLGPGRSRSFSFPPTVAGDTADGTVIDWEASVSDGGGLLASASATITVESDPRLSLAIDENRDPVPPGGEIIYTLNYGNRSDGTVTGTQMQFPLPPGTSFVAATAGGTSDGSTVTWNLGTLPARSSSERRVTVAVDGAADAGTLVAASASIDGTSSVDFLPAGQRATAVAYVATAQGPALSLDVWPRPARPGQQLRVEVTVTNETAFQVFNTNLQMLYPTGMNAVFESLFTGPFANNCSSTSCSAGEFMTWNLGTLNPGQSRVFSLPPVVASSTVAGRLVSWLATLSADGGIVVDEQTTGGVGADPALTLAIAQAANPLASGAETAYTLHYGNRSAAVVTGTQLRFTVPANTSFVAAGGGGVFADGQVTWTLGTLPGGAVGLQRVELAVDGALASGTLVEAAAVVDGTSSLTFASTERHATATAYVAPASALAVSLDAAPAPAGPGTTLDVEVTLTHTGPFQVFGSRVDMRHPADANAVFESFFTGPFTNNCSSTSCSPGENMTWEAGTLNPGQSLTFSLPPTAASVPTGTLVPWRALVTDDSGALVSAARTVDLREPELAIAVEESADPVVAGATLTYTVRYGNRSANAVTGATLHFALPANASFASATGGGVLDDDEVNWALGSLAVGEIGSRQVTVTVDGGLANGALLEGTATVEGTSGATFLATAARVGSVAYVAAGTPLALTLDVDPQPAFPGQTLDVELVVTNTSAVQVFGTEVAMRLPGGMNTVFESAFTGPFSNNCSSTSCSAHENMRWDVGTLAPGASVRMTLPPTVANSTPVGHIIAWKAQATEDSGSLRHAARALGAGFCVGVDSDGDNVCDQDDNCTIEANIDQADSDGDGFGNACDFDYDNNCETGFSDLNRLKLAFFAVVGDAAYDPALDADGSGDIGFNELNAMKLVFFGAPGPSAADPCIPVTGATR